MFDGNTFSNIFVPLVANSVDPLLLLRSLLKNLILKYRGADKSLARPGRKQANVSVRMA